MNAIYRRELRANLFSMPGTIFIVFTLVMLGIFCGFTTFTTGSPHLQHAVYDASFMSLLAVPILTMRSFSEERQNKTDQLLYSLPLTTGDIVLGKFFALATVMAVPTAILCLYPLVTASFCTAGSINFALIYSTILCYYLLGCAIIAICMFLSSLTESQVISAVMSIAAVILIFYMPSFAGIMTKSAAVSLAVVLVVAVAIAYIVYISVKNYIIAGAVGAALVIGTIVTYVVKASLFEGLIGKIFNKLAVFEPIYNFVNGIFDVSTLIYYISAICLFVFFTVQTVEKRRWN
jgi:ABC-2 type transport system permease protein